MVEIPSMPHIRVAMVPLVEAEAQDGLIRSANLDVADNMAGINARNRAACVSDVWYASRVPGHLDEKIWDDPDEMVAELPPSDIDYLFDRLTILQDYASPSFANLSDKDIDELKKGFGAIEWRELTGRQASALVQCISLLLPELLAAKFFSFGSTQNSTQQTESETSTLDASRS
jgi:hypothetical protein